jgi:hypothetical protein
VNSAEMPALLSSSFVLEKTKLVNEVQEAFSVLKNRGENNRR